MTCMTLLPASERPPVPPEDLCSVCHRNPVYIGTMCRQCHEDRQKPAKLPEGTVTVPAERRTLHYTDEQIVRVVHAANIAMQEIWGDDMPSVPWAWEPREQRRIVLAGLSRVRQGGLDARENHQLWLEDKRRQGWTPGEKDPEAKTHPDLLDWEDLSQEARDKAELFVAIIRALRGKR